MNTRSDLFIDKISLTVAIDAGARDALKTGLDELNNWPGVDRETNQFSEAFKRYRYAYWITLSRSSRCLVQLHPKQRADSRHRYMRLEWNPNKAGVGCGHRLLNLLREAHPALGAHDLVNGNVTRIDLAFDLHRIAIESLAISTVLRVPFSGKYQTHCQYSPEGRLNELEIGRSTGDAHLRVYDKREEERNRQTLRVQGTSTQRTSTFVPAEKTRFEFTLKDVGRFSDILAVSNPFERYRISSYNLAPHPLDDHSWTHFLDSCRHRGAQAALSMISSDQVRLRYRNRLRLGTPSWWRPGVIWAELPTAISRIWDSSGINPENA